MKVGAENALRPSLRPARQALPPPRPLPRVMSPGVDADTGWGTPHRREMALDQPRELEMGPGPEPGHPAPISTASHRMAGVHVCIAGGLRYQCMVLIQDQRIEAVDLGSLCGSSSGRISFQEGQDHLKRLFSIDDIEILALRIANR